MILIRYTVLVLIDFSKAFDTVVHRTLVKKLSRRFGFTKTACAFVESYLTNRSSIIFSNGSQSSPIPNDQGVPQGSILGPLFYCLYCEDIDFAFKYCKVHYYADDTQLYLDCELESLNQAVLNLNEDLQKLISWSTLNGLGINALKSQCIIFSRKSVDISTITRLEIAGEKLDFISTVNNLGILMTSNLSWDAEIKKRCYSIFSGLRQLWCVAKILPRETKLHLVKSLLGHNFTTSDVIVGELSSQKSTCNIVF